MSYLKRVFYYIFPKVEIDSDFTEKELEILKKVGFKTFSQNDLKRMNTMKKEMQKAEKEQRFNSPILTTN